MASGASFWHTLSILGLGIIPTFFMGWAYVYIEREYLIDSHVKKLLHFSITIILSILTLTSNLIIDQRPETFYFELGGWMYRFGTYYYFLLGYVVSSLTGSMILLVIYRFKTKDAAKRKQILLFVLGLFLMLVNFGLMANLQPKAYRN